MQDLRAGSSGKYTSDTITFATCPISLTSSAAAAPDWLVLNFWSLPTERLVFLHARANLWPGTWVPSHLQKDKKDPRVKWECVSWRRISGKIRAPRRLLSYTPEHWMAPLRHSWDSTDAAHVCNGWKSREASGCALEKGWSLTGKQYTGSREPSVGGDLPGSNSFTSHCPYLPPAFVTNIYKYCSDKKIRSKNICPRTFDNGPKVWHGLAQCNLCNIE